MRGAACAFPVLSLLAAAAPVDAHPGDTQIIWGSYNDYLATTGATSAGLNPDGRYVAFHSRVGILVPGQSPPGHFVQDRHTLDMRWISGGTGTPSLSADGQTVAFRDDGDWSEGPGIYASWERVSVGLGGVPANATCGEAPLISGDGRFVAFACSATNLVPGDTNGASDIFVRDRQAGSTQRVNLGPRGVQANAASFLNSISPDGRYVVFTTRASNLVPGDTNRVADVFLRDRRTGVTERVSLRDGGGQASGASRGGYVSADGRYVVFTSESAQLVAGDTNGVADVFLRDRVGRMTERLSVNPRGVQANRAATAYGLSADGRYVALISAATNLSSGDSNPGADVFVLDRNRRSFELATVNGDGVQGSGDAIHASLSRDGRAVSFSTTARLDPMHFARDTPTLYVHELSWAPRDPLTLVPAAVEFGPRRVGSRTTRAFTLRNTGRSAVALQQVDLKGISYEAFPMRSNCGRTLAAGASCSVTITFQPKSAVRELVVLRVVDSNSRVLARTVAGTGVGR